MDYSYIKRFQDLGFGLFIHFGLYSIVGKGEWYFFANPKSNEKDYCQLPKKFIVHPNWAKQLVAIAKKAGAKYICLTTRHHDGFSLYDTCGLNDYDAPHSASHRDLIKEFVDACNEGGIVPFFYHTLLDWYQPNYERDFNCYLDYLYKSVEILCTKYGKIGGLWFDGYWNKPSADWKFDRLYQMIKKYQPEAMIVNNTGLDAQGKVSHTLVDSVTFERGKPNIVDNSDRPRAGEMCESINDHWGYTKKDYTYKSVSRLLDTLLICRECNCNFLLNVGPKGNGTIPPVEKQFLLAIGDWIKRNKNFIYHVRPCDVTAINATIVKDENHYYAIIRDVPMQANESVAKSVAERTVAINSEKKVKHAKYLDNAHRVKIINNQFTVESFKYGISQYARVVQFDLE
ncbi:MAG: alpha-L-fucosidase [Bacilli bacterium]|nr:alpha-L-fucosidase [Bacilli bacterium]